MIHDLHNLLTSWPPAVHGEQPLQRLNQADLVESSQPCLIPLKQTCMCYHILYHAILHQTTPEMLKHHRC